ncbi:hypothetical protein RHMOL_Rhmol05G0294100 [Rhododendron molle]|uniref:Uncharacterized protein n=1 Tax=Rhododendron molle TaxID=49168 RepID=A0ACC0NUH6_RHOML|nr:hypothetical protein RHMOL_Rhmol05G0294100 [Rhododendron molle]
MSGQAGNHDENSRRVETIANKIHDCTAKYDDLFPSARIFKVAEDLRKQNRSANTPRLIAIGPLHRKDKHLQTPMQHIKWCYTHALIFDVENVVGDGKNNKVLGECLKKLKGCISKAKKYYAEVDSARKNDAEDVTLVCKGQKYNAEEVTLVYKGQKYNAEEVKVAHKARKYDSEEVTLVYKAQKDNAEEVEGVHEYDASEVTPVEDDEMLEMMLVDGCFILRLLWLSYQRKELVKAAKKGQDPIDPIFDNILTSALVQQDLILLENQIPFFVLEHLFEVTVTMISGANKLSLEDYVRSYWENYIKGPEYESSGSKKTSCCLPVDCFLSVGDCVLSVGHRSTKESAQAGKADQFHHIFHLLHEFFLPVPGDHPVENKQKKLCGLEASASDLHYAGVIFAPAEDKNLLTSSSKNLKAYAGGFAGPNLKSRLSM